MTSAPTRSVKKTHFWPMHTSRTDSGAKPWVSCNQKKPISFLRALCKRHSNINPVRRAKVAIDNPPMLWNRICVGQNIGKPLRVRQRKMRW